MARKCPHCSREMRLELVQGIGLDLCFGCGGIWFPADMLRLLLFRDPIAMREIEALSPTHVSQSLLGPSEMCCPECGFLLDRYHYEYNSPVVLHTCHRCGGFWVAHGELAKMEAWRHQAHRPLNVKEKAGVALAEATVAHMQEMYRIQNVSDFIDVLRVSTPGWFGFLP